jgi:hypothetical protein
MLWQQLVVFYASYSIASLQICACADVSCRAALFHLQGLVDGDGAIMLVEPRHLDQLLHPTFENEKAYQRDVITRGLGASPGAAVGKLVFTAGKLCC